VRTPPALREVATDALIEAQGITAGYGRVPVIQDLDLLVQRGEVVALLGPNGAGKTTTLLTLGGELPLTSGHVLFRGVPTRAPLHRRSRGGLAYVTEERSVFMRLTVAENLRVASADCAMTYQLFPELARLARQKAGLLSGGEQQMLALARALARRPVLLMADELSLGLAPLVVARLLQAVRSAADEQRLGVLIVEQHVRNVLRYADRVYVMRRGRVAMQGTAIEMQGRMAEIEDSYLSDRSQSLGEP
jgi:branched-chain amino acid transport system ATP-binding protein